MILKIQNSSGTYVDITPYIAYKGIKYTRNDIDGPNAGRALNGAMIRDRVAIKDKLEITCIPLKLADVAALYQLIEPEFVTVQYTSPRTGTTVTKTMYSNNVPAAYALKKGTDEYWDGIEFPLVEK